MRTSSLKRDNQLLPSKAECESRARSQRETVSVPTSKEELLFAQLPLKHRLEHSRRTPYEYKRCRDVAERAMAQCEVEAGLEITEGNVAFQHWELNKGLC